MSGVLTLAAVVGAVIVTLALIALAILPALHRTMEALPL